MWKALILPIGLVTAACSPPGSEPAAKSDMEAMTASESGAAIAGSGTVVAVDAAAGTVTLNHQPIAALSWPAMTMQFTAENALLQGVAAGDQVDFELKSALETQVITAIHKQ